MPRTRAGILKRTRYASPFSLLLSFLSRFSLFHLGRMARRLKIQRPFLARSQNSTTFFSFMENSTTEGTSGFLGQTFSIKITCNVPGRGGRRRKRRRGSWGITFIIREPPTRNGFCLLRREGEIIFCYKSMDPRVFNQILRFFVLEEEEDTMEKTSWI